MSLDIIRSHLRNGELELARHGAVAAIEEASDDDVRGRLWGLLARIYSHLGRPREAMDAAERGSEKSEHWEVKLGLGVALVSIGEPTAARAVLSEALNTQSRATGRDADILAEILLGTSLAETCRAAGDPAAGLQIAERSVAMARTCTGSGSVETADALLALGMCRYGIGRPDAAREALLEALAIRRSPKLPNPDTAEAAAILDGLGIVERARGKPFRAVDLHRQALELWLSLLGPKASPVGGCRHCLAQALHRTGDFLASRDEMELAVQITANSLGDDHVDTWITRFELARMQLDAGDIFEGMDGMQKAYGIVRTRLGDTHPVVLAMKRYI